MKLKKRENEQFTLTPKLLREKADYLCNAVLRNDCEVGCSGAVNATDLTFVSFLPITSRHDGPYSMRPPNDDEGKR